MIKFSISAAGEQTLKKICNHCKCEIQDLNMDDKFAIIGGYNWLSDSKSTKLNERSWVISSKEFVIQERDKIVMGR